MGRYVDFHCFQIGPLSHRDSEHTKIECTLADATALSSATILQLEHLLILHSFLMSKIQAMDSESPATFQYI